MARTWNDPVGAGSPDRALVQVVFRDKAKDSNTACAAQPATEQGRICGQYARAKIANSAKTPPIGMAHRGGIQGRDPIRNIRTIRRNAPTGAAHSTASSGAAA